MKTSLFNWLLVTVMTALLVAGCSDDDNPANDNNTLPDELVGTWTHQSVTLDGTPQDMADFFEWDVNAVKAHVIINANKTQRYEELDDQDAILYYDEGPISINGQSIEVTVNSENGQSVTPYTAFTGTWALSGNQLTLTGEDGGHTIVITLTKE